MLYKSYYSYNNEGWLIKEQFTNRSNVLLAYGEYTFDKIAYETTYKLIADPAQKQLLTQITSDYTGKLSATRYYLNNKVVAVLSYVYDEAGYYSKISTADSAGKLVSYETFEYYKPYYHLKKNTTYDSRDSVTSYYIYDEVGNLTDFLIVPVIFTPHYQQMSRRDNLSFSIRSDRIFISSPTNQSLSFSLVNSKGVSLVNFINCVNYTGFNTMLLPQPLATGVYFVRRASDRGFLTYRLLVR